MTRITHWHGVLLGSRPFTRTRELYPREASLTTLHEDASAHFLRFMQLTPQMLLRVVDPTCTNNIERLPPLAPQNPPYNGRARHICLALTILPMLVPFML